MAQGPLVANIAVQTVGSAKAYRPAQMDASGNLAEGLGINTTLNVTAAAVIKATPGRISRISVVTAPGTSGALTINDCATIGAATTANQVWSIAYNATAMVGGAVFTIDMPCAVGIVVSAVGGGSPQYSISYT